MCYDPDMELSEKDAKLVADLRENLKNPEYREYWEQQAGMRWDMGNFARPFVLLALQETE